MDATLLTSGHLVFYALAALLIAALIAFGNRAYRKGYLSRWHLTWLLVGLVDILIYLRARPFEIARMFDPVISLAIGFGVGVACWGFLAGGFEMALRRPFPLRASRFTLIGAGLTGLMVSVLLLTLDFEWRAYAALDSIATGLVAVLGALLLLWERRGRLAPGFIVCFAALSLFGFSTVLDASQFLSPHLFTWIYPVVLFSIVLTGCSILLFAVEDDRQAALLAASQIEHIAYYDPLTGLPNRSLFLDKLITLTSQAEQNDRAALLFIDIDHLKRVNDSFGHATGDIVIRTAATRIKESVRASDTAARFAGDEFIVLLENLQSHSDAKRIARKILSTLARPIPLGQREIRSGGTIGISFFPEHGVTADDLIRNADTAMYLAKNEGRNRYKVFSQGFLSMARSKVETEEALHKAIEGKQLSVLYQPMVRLADGSIRGVEALVRWENDLLGTIPPSEFIPLAEASRLIAPLGELVLHQTCRDASNLMDDRNKSIFFSINLSREQFVDPGLIPRVLRAIDRSGVDPRLLQFEVAESAVMTDPGRSIRIFDQLRETGVRVAIDNFGPGQFSLSFLALFSIDTLKLDRSLMTDDHFGTQATIFSAAVSLAKRFGFMVTAEGIEKPEHRRIALDEGCELGQGYLFSKPVDLATVRRLLTPSGEPYSRIEDSETDLDSEIGLVSSATDRTSGGEESEFVSIVVDDDERVRSLIATLLRRVGHDVVVAADGGEAIQRLESLDDDQISLVVLDLMMSNVSGWDVLEYVSSKRPQISSRIMVVTAVGSEQIERINEQLYGAVIEKPFDQADFYDCVERCRFTAAEAGPGENGRAFVH